MKESVINKFFSDEQACLDYLEIKRWNGLPISPFDPASKVYKCKNGNYRCRNTGKYFNVKTCTIFYNSKIPLLKWFEAILLLNSSEKVWNSVSLSAELELTQKSTWYLMHKLKRHLGVQSIKKIRDNRSGDTNPEEYKLGDWLKNLKV